MRNNSYRARSIGRAMALAPALVIAIGGASAASAAPDGQSTFVMADRVPVMLTRPASGPAPHVAILYENGQSVTQPMCKGMAARGFVTLCAIEGQHPAGWESVAEDMASLVRYARALPGITKVVLYGHSGGGAVASFYQATAENGLAFCQDARKLSACDSRLAKLPPADGVVFPDAHPGLGVMSLREVNPSLSSDGRTVRVDPALDPYSPANGFNPSGPSKYSADFVARYTKAQATQMDAMIAQAKRVRSDVAAGAITDASADQVVRLGGSHTGHLDELDPTIASTQTTARPRRLLRNDGTIVVQPIRSSSVGAPDAVPKRPSVPGAVVQSSALFLSRGATPGRDSLVDFDFCTSNSNTLCNVGFIAVPTLFIPSGANNFIRDEERMYERSPAKDKEYVVVEGAMHPGTPCVACEKTPGQYSRSLDNLFNYVAAWINKRF